MTDQNQTAARKAFRAGYLRAKMDALDRCRVEKTGGQAHDLAIEKCVEAIQALDVRHALNNLIETFREAKS